MPKAGKQLKVRAPMVTNPIINIPYERIACDLVGPLPRTKAGHRYILTAMCMASRYPYAIPLKRVDARTVAEALMTVVASTGIPKEILHDQGTVFMGKINTEMCKMLGISKAHTSPYHPQSNGVLERWHGCLKTDNGDRQWDYLLKFVLLAYRATPHSVTRFSPYELGHGRQLRGPLDAVKEGWLGGSMTEVSSNEWVEELRKTLNQLHEKAREHQEVAKQERKIVYDKQAKMRQFSLGDMELVHTPTLTCSLDSIWEGPYKVVGRTSEVTYQVAAPDRRKKTLTTHINRLKRWT